MSRDPRDVFGGFGKFRDEMERLGLWPGLSSSWASQKLDGKFDPFLGVIREDATIRTAETDEGSEGRIPDRAERDERTPGTSSPGWSPFSSKPKDADSLGHRDKGERSSQPGKSGSGFQPFRNR
jgi:hypothetical protein